MVIGGAPALVALSQAINRAAPGAGAGAPAAPAVAAPARAANNDDGSGHVQGQGYTLGGRPNSTGHVRLPTEDPESAV